jgi:hypothetical protein
MSDIVIHKQTYTIIPQGTYKGIIDSMEKVAGRFGDQIQFKIRINIDGVEGLEGGDVTLTAWASAKYGEKTKLYRWNRAALGPDFNSNADFSAIAMKEKRVLVVVETHISPDGGEYNRVSDLLAAPRGKRPQPAAPSPSDDDCIPWPYEWAWIIPSF